MTTSYLFWASIVTFGIVAGAVLKPRTIAVLIASAFFLCLIGLIVSASMGATPIAWMFGVAGIGVPVALLISYILGAVVYAVIRVKVTDTSAATPASPPPVQEQHPSSSDQ